MKINQRQESFCINYFRTGNATQSAIEAGYSKHTASVIAVNLLKKENVKTRLAELHSQAVSDAIMTVIKRKERLSEIARSGKPNESVNAIAELNMMEKVYASSPDTQVVLEVVYDNPPENTPPLPASDIKIIQDNQPATSEVLPGTQE
jgi:phage terminase small subunit